MQRRLFVKKLLVFTGGTLTLNPLVSCSKSSFELESIVGRNENILNTYKKHGNKTFAYYKLDDVNHQNFGGNLAFVYCENQKIVGYTIKIKEIEDFDSKKELLITKYGKAKLLYENSFGESYEWKDTKRKYHLVKVKAIENVLPLTFFSESNLDNDLIVF